jgi:hypothetical protein
MGVSTRIRPLVQSDDDTIESEGHIDVALVIDGKTFDTGEVGEGGWDIPAEAGKGLNGIFLRESSVKRGELEKENQQPSDHIAVIIFQAGRLSASGISGSNLLSR